MSASRISPLAWAGLMTLAVVAADYITGPFVQVSIFYIAPVAAAAFHRASAGCALAVLLPLSRGPLNTYWAVPWSLPDTIGYAVIRIAALLAVVLLIRRVLLEPAEAVRPGPASDSIRWRPTPEATAR